MRIDIVSDTVCPWCYIGKRRLEKAMKQRPDLDFTIVWKPFQLNPDMPPGGLPREAYLDAKFGGPEGAKRIYDRIESEGRKEEIPFSFSVIERSPNTLASHQLIKWAQSAGVQDQVVERLFERYFVEGADISDRDVLIEVARETGTDTELVAELLDQDADREMVRQEGETARSSGITGVPCFIIDNKYVVMGAEPPETFLQLFDQVAGELAAAGAAS